ncbi:MAG: ABC transporter ATP-binding protein [Chlamydiales bacterium]
MKNPLLEVVNLNKQFKVGRQTFQVLKDLSFNLAKGEIIGLGGESGCGKSTLGKAVLRLIEPTSGSIRFNGQDLMHMSKSELQQQRRHMQMIFQNPTASINPKFTVKEILSEPLDIHGMDKGAPRNERLNELLQQVGLDSYFLNRFPHELSGGQKQRIAIARALALAPALIVCDEPFSALDVSVQLQIIHLLQRLQEQLGLAYLLISHDLSALRFFTHRLAIMYMGQLMEMGPTESVYRNPLHPYTQALISAVPIPDPQLERKRQPIILKGELPSLFASIKGCPFHTRCPYASEVCREVTPEKREVGNGHFVACHLV